MEFRSIRIAATLVVLLAIVMVMFSLVRSPEGARIPANPEADPLKAPEDPCLNTVA